MHEKSLAAHLDFLVQREQQDEATLLARALRTGVEALYQEALTEAYLQGEVVREVVVQELGPDKVEEIEYQRDALRRDFEWGLQLPDGCRIIRSRCRALR